MGLKAADFHSVSIAKVLGSDQAHFQTFTRKGKLMAVRAKRLDKFKGELETSLQRIRDRGEGVAKHQHPPCPSCRSLNTVPVGSQQMSLGMDEGSGTVMICRDCKFRWASTVK